MGLLTAIRNLRYPVSTDAFNPPLHFKQLADDVDVLLDPAVDLVGDLPASGNWPGRSMYVIQERSPFVWEGSAWRRQRAFGDAQGTAQISLSSSANFGTVAFVLPAGRFTLPPKVTVTISNAPGGSQTLIPRSYNVTKDGGSVAVYSGNFPTTIGTPTQVNLDWHAVQATSAAAAG